MIDPSQNLNGRHDITIADGRIAAILTPEEGKAVEREAHEILDAAECYVVPGLIDLHAHVFAKRTPLGVRADRVGVEQGVTTVVDAGSAGAWTFAQFQKEAVEPAETRVLAFLNIAGDGLCAGLSELSDISRLAPQETVTLIRQQPLIRGIKVRMSGSVVKQNGIAPLAIARQAAREAGCPLMVHIGNAPPALPEVLQLLDEGDVVTHAFHGKKGGILDESGQLIPAAEAALARGVLFDVGHGNSSFSFRTMHQAKALGIAPHTISTDIYRYNVDGPVFSLTHTMTKFLALGFSLYDIVAACTIAPASILGRPDLGTLRVGACADVTVLQVRSIPTTLTDAEQETIRSDSRLTVQHVITAGKVRDCE